MTSRQIAKQNGDKTYEGKPCVNCKGVQRRTDNGSCVVCARNSCKLWHKNNKECRLLSMKQWRTENKEKCYAKDRNWRINNPLKVRAKKVRRKVAKLNALPSWLPKDTVDTYYTFCPTGYHVDHIVPLIGKRKGEHVVCGLHVPWNLQYLKAEDNLRKSCHHWPNM